MQRILFLENGTSGGGSFESLSLIVSHLDLSQFTPLVVFVNRTVFFEQFKARNVPVRLLYDPVYSKEERCHTGRWLWTRGLMLMKRIAPWTTLGVEAVLHLPAVRALTRVMKEEQIDVIQLNNHSMRDLYGVIAAKRLRIPCISYLRSARTVFLPSSVARFLNRHVAQFVANSHFTKQYWSRLGIDAHRIQVIYNAVKDASVETLNVRKEWKLNSGVQHVLGCVGNFSEGKGQDFLLRTFAYVLEQEPHTALLMVGDGPRRPALVQLAQNLGVSHAVIFTGYDSRGRRIIAGLNLLVLPSHMEAFGRTLLEAMAEGIPVVATRVGGIPEVIEHEKNGLLADFGDAEGFAEAICRMLRDQSLRTRCIQESKRRVRADFSLTTHIRMLEHVWRAQSM
ncbi:hypothetical protein A3B32_00130 [Candidatus Uhrbacteria bacterium RIFCSPLOWO2_01_FULL_53_9]|uniref:Glycosyl transferase family 1 domain-containing protein n=1 Tax=Candidatus Uhrbacteria bacterium RIFCSPLOWO2_01_FULL_53_9 TaxID=1802403 RepID=A0A1F7UWJ4_9BACT|nr:MAG: hypothetical protein A3B32_00130 [Candidatus Uhrbacteria bacterium RIFCSPLOWO2_01_FULL_53_9]